MNEPSLEELVTGTAPAAVTQPETTTGDPKTEEPAKPAPQEPAKTDDGKAAAPPADKTEPDHVPLAAVKDERRKRQEAERKAEDLEKRLAALEKPSAKKPDIFEDPDGVLGSLRQEVQGQILQTRIELSQDLMREKHEDYDELESEFYDLAKANPFLLQDPAFTKNPAKYAYETAKKARDAAGLKDVDKMRAELEAKVRKEVEEKIRKETEEKSKKDGSKRSATETPSLAQARAADGTFSEPPKSLGELTRLP